MAQLPTGLHPATAQSPPDVGVFGGSGFEGLLDDAHQVEIDTPFGKPSAPVAVGTLGDRRVAFMPRHGVAHELAPHKIPYRANLWAMKHLGVGRIISPCAAGSLQHRVAPGDFVVCDQLVDRTKSRGDTFFDSSPVTHVSFADPYCPDLRTAAVAACEAADVTVHSSGTVVVVEGPRFSTRAESQSYTQAGWEVINMTQHPEAALAREAEMCFVNISLITDYDAGFSLESGIEPVTVDEILEVFRSNNDRLRSVLGHLIASVTPQAEAKCACGSALDGAQL